MKRVLKWTVPVDDAYHQIGVGRVILVTSQFGERDVLTVWTEETEALPPGRSVRAYGTGQPLPAQEEHIGSTVVAGGHYVWHLYAVPYGKVDPLTLAKRWVSPSVERIFEAEIRNEADGGVAPATLSSTIDSIAQGLIDKFEDGESFDLLIAMLMIRDILPGDTEVRALL